MTGSFFPVIYKMIFFLPYKVSLYGICHSWQTLGTVKWLSCVYMGANCLVTACITKLCNIVALSNTSLLTVTNGRASAVNGF